MSGNWKRRLSLTAAVICISAGFSVSAEDKIAPGLSIGMNDVSGYSYDLAESLVEGEVAEMLSSTIKVTVGLDSIDASAVDLGIQWKNQNVVEDAVEYGNSGNPIKRYKDEKDLSAQPQQLKLVFAANADKVRSFIENKCSQFEREPKEASIRSDGNGGVDIEAGQVGQSIDVEASVQQIMDYVANGWYNSDGSVEISVKVVEPKGDTKALEEIHDCLGTCTTYYGSTEGRNNNVERGAELINGHILWPGDSFSVCDHLVPFTPENGYELGGAYAEGRVVQEYGGGICQVSSTLYNAVLQAELEVEERHCHTMSVSYLPTSMDAAIAEGNMDFIFRNNLDYPVFLSGYAYGGELTFSVWGKETRPADRYIYFDSQTTSVIDPPTTTKMIMNPEYQAGYFSLVQGPQQGSTAVLYKYITQGDDTTVEQVNSSTYEACEATYEVGTLGATDALLMAIYSGDIAAAQLAAAGKLPETESETEQTESEAQTEAVLDLTGVVTEPTIQGGYIDTPDGEMWVDDLSSY